MAFEAEIKRLFKTEFAPKYTLYIFDGYVYVEGVKKLLSVSEKEISFTTKEGCVSLFGSLTIADSGKGYLAISGKTTRVEINE